MWRRNSSPRPAPWLARFDQAGDVGQDDGAVFAQGGHAEVGPQRGKGVIGDLGAGGSQRGQQRALAGVGQTDDADVGDQLQL